mgnify:CR=1 FL=1
MELLLDLRKYRELAGKTQEEAAGILGISQSQYSRIEAEPNNLPIELLIKIQKAFSIPQNEILKIFIQSDFNLNGLNPGNVYREIYARTNLIREYLDEFLNNTDGLSEEEDIKKFEELKFLLIKLSRKPNLLFLGHYDCGKTRIVNNLLRSNYLPTEYGPATKVTHIIKHKTEKLQYMKENEDVWIIKVGMDVNRIDDEQYTMQYVVAKGDISLLKEYGVIGNDKADATYFIMVFIDAELLQACNIIDTPGSGNEDIDEKMLSKIIADSTLQMDVLVFASRFQGFLDSLDFDVLGNVLNRLPKIISDKNNKSLPNLFIVATHADQNKTDNDIEIMKTKAVERLFRMFGSTLFADLKITDKKDVSDRIFTFWAELPSRYEKFENEILDLVKNIIPEIVKNEFKTVLENFKNDKKAEVQAQINFYQARLNEHEKAAEEYKILLQQEPDRRKYITKERIDINDYIITLKNESKNEIYSYIERKLNVDNLEQFIRNNFGNKEDAAKEIGAIISEKINHKLKKIIEQKSEELRKRMEKFFKDYNPNVVDDNTERSLIEIPFDARGAFIGGLTTLTSLGAYAIWAAALGNLGGYILVAKVVGLLSALGISVGGGAAATSFISVLGGPITIAIGIGVLLGYLAFRIFGESWQRRLAKKFIEKWNKNNATNQYIDINEKFWDDSIKVLHIGFDNMESEWQDKLNNLGELALPENKVKFERRVKDLGDLLSFFVNIPLE